MDFYAVPSPPQAPLLDPDNRTWTLSRYADVQSAMRDPACRQISEKGQVTYVAGAPDHLELRATVLADVDRLSSPQVHTMMLETARSVFAQVPRNRTINLVTEVIEPWVTEVFLKLSTEEDDLREQLAGIIPLLLYRRDKDPSWWARRVLGQKLSADWYKARRKKAEARLVQLVSVGKIKLTKPTFLGGTQTLPSFLAKAWLALLQNPEQMSKLRDNPNSIGWAVEELLRYSGSVHTLHRLATEDIVIGDAAIAKGDHIILKLESANRDPLRFDSPNCLDISRRPSGNLGLGTGAHACAGAAIIRIAATLITPVFVAASPCLDPDIPVFWTGDSSVRWPTKVPARLTALPEGQ